MLDSNLCREAVKVVCDRLHTSVTDCASIVAQSVTESEPVSRSKSPSSCNTGLYGPKNDERNKQKKSLGNSCTKTQTKLGLTTWKNKPDTKIHKE